MGAFSIGQSVRRREDPRLLMGRGRYFDDLKLADQFHAAIVRSPHAHADIKSIDTRAALQMPGVHAVLTGKDYEADGLGTMPSMAPYKKRDGSAMYLPYRPAVAIDRVLHVGYPVAVVVADTLDLARDAAERVEVDYAPRPAVVSARDAFEPRAPPRGGGGPPPPPPPRWCRRATRSTPARRSSTPIAQTTRFFFIRPATRPRPIPRSLRPRM